MSYVGLSDVRFRQSPSGKGLRTVAFSFGMSIDLSNRSFDAATQFAILQGRDLIAAELALVRPEKPISRVWQLDFDTPPMRRRLFDPNAQGKARHPTIETNALQSACLAGHTLQIHIIPRD